MATPTAPNLALGYGSEAYTKYTDAQKRLDDMLANRENRLFDPVMLAMSQGFLAPTKTGSFGESLGNVAAAVGPAQAAESRNAMELAKMRLDVAQQGLTTDIGLQRQSNINADIAKNTVGYTPPTTAPAAPSAIQGTQAAGASVMPPAIGGAPAALPATGGALPSGPATPTAPAAPQGPLSTVAQAPQAQQPPAQMQNNGILGGIPLGIPSTGGGMNLTPAEANIVKIGISDGKSLPDMYKYVAERRNDETVWKEGFGVHRPTNTFIPAPSAEQVEIQLPGDRAPRKVFKSDSMALQHYAQTNDPRYNEVLDRMKNGPQVARQPVVQTGSPSGTAPPPQVGLPTTTDVAAEKARAEAEASAAGTSAGKRTGAAMDKYETAMESKNSAISIKELISQPGAELTMGVLEKPTVKAAIAGMVASGKGIFDEDKFRDAYTKINIKYNVAPKQGETKEEYAQRKQEMYDRGRQVASQAAMLQFQASMLAKGQGAISNNERQLFADTTIGVKDSVSTINKKADMIIARADFAKTVSDTINEKGISLDKFKLTPEYKKLETNYENSLRDIWNPNRKKSQGTPSAGSPDLEAARKRLEARLP
jgi:hypothetical protein